MDIQSAMIMFDLTDRATYNNAVQWNNNITKWSGDIPRVLVGSKSDSESRAVRSKYVTLPRKQNMGYVEISSQAGSNLKEPLLCLASKVDMTKETVSILAVAEHF